MWFDIQVVGCGLDGLHSTPRRKIVFCLGHYSAQISSGSHTVFYLMSISSYFLEVKSAEVSDYSISYITDIKNAWNCKSDPTYVSWRGAPLRNEKATLFFTVYKLFPPVPVAARSKA